MTQSSDRPESPLPIILSRPHGGLDTPPEIVDCLAIDQLALYNDCDLWIDQLFDFGHDDLADLVPAQCTPGVLATESMPIARALIDVNRPLERLGTPDGPVKTRTSYGAPIYTEPLSDDMQQRLLDRYWWSYHNAIDSALQEHAGQAKLFIDCHNMAQHGPSAYPDAGQARPLICIANLGDAQGEPRPDFEWTLCSSEFALKAAEIADELFGDMELLEPEPGLTVPTVLLNSPFGGSYVAAHHLNPQRAQQMVESTGYKPPTAIMVEVNRGLLVGDQTAATAMTPPNEERIRIIRRKLYQWAVRLVEHL